MCSIANIFPSRLIELYFPIDRKYATIYSWSGVIKMLILKNYATV